MNPKRLMSRILLLIALAVLGTGCVSSRTTTLPQEWRAPVSSGSFLDATEDGDRVVAGQEKAVVALDGRTGEERWTEAEDGGLLGALLSSSTFRVGGLELSPSDYEAERYSTVVLEEQEAVVLLDYSLDTDEIIAVDLGTGEELWRSEEFAFSPARYDAMEDVLQQIASGGGLGGAAAGVGANATAAEARAQTPIFLEDVIAEVPALEAFLFKTRDGLALMETRSGRTLWTSEEIEGLGVSGARHLPAHDDLIVVNYTPRGNFDRQIARVDARTGEAVWVAPYSALPTAPSRDLSTRIHVADGVVLLEEFGLEAYDLETGEKLWQTHPAEVIEARWWESGAWSRSVAAPVIDDGAAYIVDNASETGFRCIDDCGLVVRKHDLRTGERLWEAGPWEEIPLAPGAGIVDGIFAVALSTSELFIEPSRVIGLDAETGEQVWSSEAELSNLRGVVFDGAALFAALGQRVQRIDGRTGAVAFDVAHDTAAVGGAFGLTLDAGDRIIVPGRRGAAAYSKADGELRFAVPVDSVLADQGGVRGEEDRVTGAMIRGGTLFLEHENGNLSVLDLETGAIRGYAVVPDGIARVPYGDLYRRGYEITPDGLHLYLVEGSAVGKYRLGR